MGSQSSILRLNQKAIPATLKFSCCGHEMSRDSADLVQFLENFEIFFRIIEDGISSRFFDELQVNSAPSVRM